MEIWWGGEGSLRYSFLSNSTESVADQVTGTPGGDIIDIPRQHDNLPTGVLDLMSPLDSYSHTNLGLV